MVKKIDGTLFADMIISGANNLCNQKSIVDNLNVFPVPDGDTGTNMSLTISAAVKEVAANREKNVLDISKILASATLRGAREIRV
ncbi:MAG: DAK2 domain-containing protein [Clostridiales bacterium]|nr:MAG: DAK2 domain-containing protein [Clostridiales bacterium]